MHVNLTRWSLSLVFVVGVVTAPNGLRAQVPCDLSDPCTVNPTCQPDGTCAGTQLPDGTSCSDGSMCTNMDMCFQGRCIGFPDIAANGMTCPFPGSEALGACFMGAVCNFGACVPQIRMCPDLDGNRCTLDFCNPSTGACGVFTNTCDFDCASGTCDPATGACMNPVPKANGIACDDFNVCTGNDRCSAGECVGMPGASGPTLTPTAAVPTPTPSPTTGPGCVGDCDADNQVEMPELISAISAALGQTTSADCGGLDNNQSGTITIEEVVVAVRAANEGCSS